MNPKDSVLELTKDLVRFRTECTNIEARKEILAFVDTILPTFTSKKFEFNNYPSSLYSNGTTMPNKFAVILNAHLDVALGTSDQFIPVEKEGKIYGRGVEDMKAAAAAMILAFKEVAPTLKTPVGLQLVTDGNSGGQNGTNYQIEQGITGDFILAGEPSSFNISTKFKGDLRIWVTFSGRKSHSAYPWGGDNAILKMNTFLNKILGMFAEVKRDSWKSTIAPTIISTPNQQMNLIPDSATLALDIRIVPEEYSVHTLLGKIKALLPTDTKLEIYYQSDPFVVSENNPYLMKLKNVAKQVTNKDINISYSNWGGGDITNYSKKGIVGIEFSPFGHGHHTDNEWVSTKSVEVYYEILKNFLLSIDSI